MKPNLPADVWRFIEVRGADECWPWTGSCDTSGYGRIGVARKYYAAHRVAYALSHPGTITLAAPKSRADGGHVLHRCDNRRCCNPRHLFLGTQGDNMRDAAQKGRRASTAGAANPNAKLTARDVEDIRWIASKGIAPCEVARKYAISWTQARKIMRGEVWRG